MTLALLMIALSVISSRNTPAGNSLSSRTCVMCAEVYTRGKAMSELDPVSSEATTQISPTTPPSERDALSADLPRIEGYRFERLLGRGGMGSVYLAEEIALGRMVAIKFITRRSDDSMNRFAREARLLATVEHPNVVRVYSFGSTEHAAYIVMEYIDGETLAEHIAREGALPIGKAIRIMTQVVDGLAAAAAKQIIHRDIKPSNILLDRAGNVHVADFGLAKPMNANVDPITHAGTVVGTPHYLSPEQAEGSEVGLHSDIYSLGVVFFEMLTGTRPFQASTPVAVIAKHLHEPCPSVAKLRRGVPRDLVSLVDRMTRKPPSERPRSYGDIVPFLERAEAAQKTKTISLTTVFAALGVLTFLYLLFAFSESWWLRKDAPQLEETRPATTKRAPRPRIYDGEPISLQLKNAELEDVLRTFGELTGFNFAVDPDVSSKQITVDWADVPWDAAFETILRQNRLTYSVEGNIVRVGRIERFIQETEDMARLGLAPPNVGASLPATAPAPAPAKGAPSPVAAGAVPLPAPVQLLPPPELLAPADHQVVEIGASVAMQWSTQPNASAYQLQISRSRLFPGLEINAKRQRSSATTRVTKSGNFYWRVASIDTSGRIGPFSDYRTFKVR